MLPPSSHRYAALETCASDSGLLDTDRDPSNFAFSSSSNSKAILKANDKNTRPRNAFVAGARHIQWSSALGKVLKEHSPPEAAAASTKNSSPKHSQEYTGLGTEEETKAFEQDQLIRVLAEANAKQSPKLSGIKSNTSADGLRVVASISSFGHRLFRIEESLMSMWNQTRRPDRVYVHVPRKVKRLDADLKTLPKSLMEMERMWNGWLVIVRPEDYGPSTKLLGTLLVEHDPNTLVLTVDDDTVYHPEMLETLIKAYKSHPHTFPCFICEEWNEGEGGPGYKEDDGECHGWGNAFAGVLYQVGFFDKSIFDYTGRPEGCKLHDDVYISGYLYERGIRPYVRSGFSPILYNKDHTELSIHLVPETESGYRDPCIRHFNFFRERSKTASRKKPGHRGRRI
ncbi:hypothetical protein HDU96_002029 [Phlyctochytrium bullatum]|nr:hypothetical protein HDU96_002029 [Phlyctochytrium bullatum]